MNTGIYKITNTVNGKFYIGKAINITKRLYQHKTDLKNNRHINKHMQASYNKYGISCFTFKPIIYCDEILLNDYERDLIYLSESYNNSIGYNKTFGGEGSKLTEETKAKISNSHKGILHSEESKKKMSLSRMGKKWDISKPRKTQVRKPLSLETRIKISNKLKGNKNNPSGRGVKHAL